MRPLEVSIAQAFPAIIRAKKMIILGDRKQFDIKTTNASKEQIILFRKGESSSRGG